MGNPKQPCDVSDEGSPPSTYDWSASNWLEADAARPVVRGDVEDRDAVTGAWRLIRWVAFLPLGVGLAMVTARVIAFFGVGLGVLFGVFHEYDLFARALLYNLPLGAGMVVFPVLIAPHRTAAMWVSLLVAALAGIVLLSPLATNAITGVLVSESESLMPGMMLLVGVVVAGAVMISKRYSGW